jgi:hypothetical protein
MHRSIRSTPAQPRCVERSIIVQSHMSRKSFLRLIVPQDRAHLPEKSPLLKCA